MYFFTKKTWEIESLDDDFPNTYELCIKPAFPESSYQKLQKLIQMQALGLEYIYFMQNH